MIDKGLCGDCGYQRTTFNKRGSSFSMCELSKEDPRFKKYPPLPVLACSGYESSGGDGDEDSPEEGGIEAC